MTSLTWPMNRSIRRCSSTVRGASALILADSSGWSPACGAVVGDALMEREHDEPRACVEFAQLDRALGADGDVAGKVGSAAQAGPCPL
jgi:hypothetical protein